MSAHIELHPHAGSDIKKISADAQRIANLLLVTVEFQFNDVLCMAVPGGSDIDLAERQQAEQARKLTGPFDRRFALSRLAPTPSPSVTREGGE